MFRQFLAQSPELWHLKKPLARCGFLQKLDVGGVLMLKLAVADRQLEHAADGGQRPVNRGVRLARFLLLQDKLPNRVRRDAVHFATGEESVQRQHARQVWWPAVYATHEGLAPVNF